MKEREETEKKEDTMVETMKNVGMMNQRASEHLGITQEYNSANRAKLWDSQRGKEAYKDKMFGNGEKYTDPVTGEVLYKNQKAAKAHCSEEWTEHASETDHINAIKDVHNTAKHNLFLTDDDLKEIVNSEENYRLLSRKDNASKGAKSDWEIIFDKDSDMTKAAKVKMAKEKVKADVALQGKFAARTAQNVGKEFIQGAEDTLAASVIPLTVEAVNNLCKVAQGEKSLGEAAKDMGKTTLGVAVAGGGNKLVLDVVNTTLKNSSKTAFKNLAGSNEVAQIISVASIVKDSAVRYINGEIDGKEFINEVGEKGTTMVAGMIGGTIGREIGTIAGAIAGTVLLPGVGTGVGVVAGRVVGEILGTIITTVACTSIVSVYKTVRDTSKHLDDYKLKEGRIKRLEAEALKEMEHQRSKFRSIVESEYHHWDEEIESGFDMVLSNACKETFDLQGVTDGLDKILAVFGKSVAFKNLDEYEAQLDMPLKLSF